MKENVGLDVENQSTIPITVLWQQFSSQPGGHRHFGSIHQTATSHSGNRFSKVNLAEMGQSIVSSSKKTLNMFMTIKCISCIFVLYLKILLHFIYLLCVFAYPCIHAVINMYQSYGSQGSMCPKQQVPLSTELHHWSATFTFNSYYIISISLYLRNSSCIFCKTCLIHHFVA